MALSSRLTGMFSRLKPTARAWTRAAASSPPGRARPRRCVPSSARWRTSACGGPCPRPARGGPPRGRGRRAPPPSPAPPPPPRAPRSAAATPAHTATSATPTKLCIYCTRDSTRIRTPGAVTDADTRPPTCTISTVTCSARRTSNQ